MNIKIIALDMDGTLLRDDHATISQRNLTAMQDAIDSGILVVPASGRTRTMLPSALNQLPAIRYALASNGAVVADLLEKRELYANRIPTPIVLRLLDLLRSYHVIPQIYCFGKMLVERGEADALLSQPLSPGVHELIAFHLNLVDSFFPHIENGGVEKLTINYVPQNIYHKLWENISAIPEVTPVSSIPGNIEINSAAANKGDGLRHLCAILDIPLSQVMAVGDAGNDVEMLKTAGVSVAMANSTPEALAAARYQTASNEGDGVALAIEKWALKKPGRG